MEPHPLPPTALVTGGGDGIGRAICIALAERGCECITVLDLDLAAAQRTAALCGSSGSVLPLSCDVTDESALEGAFRAHSARWGYRPMLCVANAGVAESKAGWRTAVQVNMFGAIATAHLALAHMRKPGCGGGAIVCLGSMGGVLPMADQPVYAATKAGVLHFVRSLAESLQLDGESPDVVRVCALAPAIVETQLAADQRAATNAERAAAADAMLAERGGLIPPSRIAEACVRLAVTRGGNGGVLRVFQDGTLKFHAQPGYPWSPTPPASLAELPASLRRASRL
tara:strand:+ start:281 stop:1132 length:852 start_codon:yes stop_codon:yes gene_type:complete